MIFLTAVWHIPSCRSQGAFSGRGDDHTTFFPGKVHEMQIIPQVAESSPSFPLDNSDHGDEGRDAQSKGGGWDKNEEFMVVFPIFYSRGHTEKIVLFIDLFIFQSFFLATQQGIQDLSSQTRDGSRTPLHWKHRILTAGVPERPKKTIFLWQLGSSWQEMTTWEAKGHLRVEEIRRSSTHLEPILAH